MTSACQTFTSITTATSTVFTTVTIQSTEITKQATAGTGSTAAVSTFTETQSASAVILETEITVTAVNENSPEPTCHSISESDAEMLAKLCAGEAGHLSDDEHRFVVWTVFNRCDEGRWGGTTISSVINAKSQFVGKNGGSNWSRGSTEYKEHLRQLAREEYEKWINGERCPECTYTKTGAAHGYNSFTGDGSHNWFTKK